MSEEQVVDHEGMVNEVNFTKSISLPLYQVKGWLRFLGLLNIIYGIISAVTLWGILWCWLFFWMGILMNSSASSIERAYLSGNSSEVTISLSKLKTMFTLQGVLAILGLVATVVAGLIAIGAGFTLWGLQGI